MTWQGYFAFPKVRNSLARLFIIFASKGCCEHLMETQETPDERDGKKNGKEMEKRSL